MKAAEGIGTIIEDPDFQFGDEGLARLSFGDNLNCVLQLQEDDYRCLAIVPIAEVGKVSRTGLIGVLKLNYDHENITFSIDPNTDLLLGKLHLCFSTLTTSEAEAQFNYFLEASNTIQLGVFETLASEEREIASGLDTPSTPPKYI